MQESIDIRLKRAAIILADELDYLAAAERINITAAELERQISSLEKQLCLYIFRARQNRVELTEEGKYLIGAFRQSVAWHDRKSLDDLQKQMSEKESGRL